MTVLYPNGMLNPLTICSSAVGNEEVERFYVLSKMKLFGINFKLVVAIV